MERIQQWIQEAEDRWLPFLATNLASCFSHTFLPSHDEGHHRRVWMHARRLLLAASGSGAEVNRGFVTDLLHASWFHDAGMSADSGEEHGRLGMELYRSFMPSPSEECASAILLHDRKEALHYRSLGKDPGTGILDYLSVADDMDALGNIGIYRYAEIYLARDFPEESLGKRILENSRTRYKNLNRACADLPAILEEIHRGYKILRDFYNLHVPESMELFALIRELGFRQRISPEKYHRHLDNNASAGLEQFCKALSNELLENGNNA